MNKIETIREFRTRHFTVQVDAVHDPDLDLTFDEDGSVLEKLDSGELMGFAVCVRVLHDQLGELGRGYLGGCIYESPAAFQDHRACGRYNRELAERGEVARCGSYFTDMIRGAIDEARENLKSARRIYVRA